MARIGKPESFFSKSDACGGLLPYGMLRERRSKLRTASRREVRATHYANSSYVG